MSSPLPSGLAERPLRPAQLPIPIFEDSMQLEFEAPQDPQSTAHADDWRKEEKQDAQPPRTFLRIAFDGLKMQKPINKENHSEFLHNTQLGRDVSLHTSEGVEFKVHSAMILGRSQMLQDILFPGDVSGS